MGSLASRPKAPVVQQQPVIQYIPQYVPATSTVSYTEPAVTSSDGTGDNADTQAAITEQRENNLLKRNRGRFGTVLTGFRGLLSSNETQEPRKSLLGE